jgi:hypothetical protein
VEAQRRHTAHIPFAGVIYAHPLRISPGPMIADLELMAKALDPADLNSRVWYLPL